MKIKKLHIKNFKSIADLEIIQPNPFTVFVRPNGSGKSNIFEALEFYLKFRNNDDSIRLFGGEKSISNVIKFNKTRKFDFITNEWTLNVDSFNEKDFQEVLNNIEEKTLIENGISLESNSYKNIPNDHPVKQMVNNSNYYKRQFSRVFIKNNDKQKVNYQDDEKLSFSCDNLEKVLKRILKDEFKREEIGEWLDLFIPGYDKVEIESNELSGTDTLLIYEKGINKPFTKELISDGSYNILCLLTVVLQSDEPQFLCIEEPENGLTPYVIREMVNFFRNACEEKGHYIWLNTHSQSLVSELSGNEIITVNKRNGQTLIKQFKDEDLHGLRTDEAWLTNVLGGGLPW